MDSILLAKLLETNWAYYLSRPFSLFQTSVWNKWYSSAQTQAILAVRMKQGLFIECPKGMVRHYREHDGLKTMFENIHKIAFSNPELCSQLLDQGIEQNEKAKQTIAQEEELDLPQALDFSIGVALVSTIFPYFAGDLLFKTHGANAEMTKKAIALRAVSYYPENFTKILIPAASRELEKCVVDANLIEFVTIDEIQNRTVDAKEVTQRKKSSLAGHQFMYFCDTDEESVSYVENSEDYLKKIDQTLFDQVKEIKGVTGNKGRATGRVRKINANSISEITFNKGDVLVAVSTNPILLPIMKKAGAIVTDEGGILSHAAIISREIGVPCVVGTKNATWFFDDGDLVEVDAERGIVKILNEV